MSSILVIDDEIAFLRSIRRILWQSGFQDVFIETNPTNALDHLRKKQFDVILLDILMPETDGMTLLAIIQELYPQIPVILISAMDSYKRAFQAVKTGAYDYIVKPPDPDRLLLTIRHAIEFRLAQRERDSLRSEKISELKQPDKFRDIITASDSMKKVFSLVEIFAPTNETILITGETGVGKDLLARKIHELSGRSSGPFVHVNLASVTPSLFESELFGHQKGSFTGAASDRAGYFEAAEGGTLFLDEIGELSKEIQGKLLRAIQYSEIYRLGSTKPVKLNIRIIAATNKDLLNSVKKDQFRADLYYRLNRGYIEIPPLRKRKEDILLLANYFLKTGNKTYNKHIQEIHPAVVDKLISYDYPGNIRELENLILNAVAKENGSILSRIDLPELHHSKAEQKQDTPSLISIDDAINRHVLQVVEYCNGNLTKAASILGVSERTVQRKLKKLKDKN
ncbi:MAG: sigma-54 dependent transcriptional regulator [Ignavibacteriaceae bacterium]